MSAQPVDTVPHRRHRVVVIGSGFGGLNAVKKLKRADVDIKLIARTTHHLFQPMLYQVATGIVAEGAIAPPHADDPAAVSTTSRFCSATSRTSTWPGKFVVSELLGHSLRNPV